MLVSDVMHACTVVDAGETVSEVAKLMDEHLASAVLVRKEGVIKGIVTERDILRKIVGKGKDPEKTTISQIMSSPLITVHVHAILLEASEIMERKNVRRLVVTEGENIVGMVNTTIVSNNMRYVTAREKLYTRQEYAADYGYF